MYSETKIAIPIFQEDCKKVVEVARDCIDKGADVLEFRIDGLKNPDIDEIKHTIKEIDFPMIATNRIEGEGGSFKGSEEDRINILYECCDLVDYVDIELQSNDEVIITKNSGHVSFIQMNNVNFLETLNRKLREN